MVKINIDEWKDSTADLHNQVVEKFKEYRKALDNSGFDIPDIRIVIRLADEYGYSVPGVRYILQKRGLLQKTIKRGRPRKNPMF